VTKFYTHTEQQVIYTLFLGSRREDGRSRTK